MLSMSIRSLFTVSALVMATPSFAAQYLVVYTGTVQDGTDYSGLFGPTSASLAGASYKAEYTLDTGVGASASDNGVVGSISGSGVNSPLKAAFTLNGVTVDFGYHVYTESAATVTNAFYDEVNLNVKDFNNGYYYYQLFNVITNGSSNMLATTDYTSALNYAIAPGDTSNGQLIISDNVNFVLANLHPESVTISGIGGAVPESSTWALMLLGFGSVGASMRRRKVTLSYA